jgi:hypothetical protein
MSQLPDDLVIDLPRPPMTGVDFAFLAFILFAVVAPFGLLVWGLLTGKFS